MVGLAVAVIIPVRACRPWRGRRPRGRRLDGVVLVVAVGEGNEIVEVEAAGLVIAEFCGPLFLEVLDLLLIDMSHV